MSEKQGLLGSEIHAILEDREGDIWIGTAGGGSGLSERRRLL